MCCVFLRFLKDHRNYTFIEGHANAIMRSINKSNDIILTTVNSSLELEDIRRQIKKMNAQQRVLNEEAFGPLAPDSPIILVQVHDRLNYLRHLIISMAQAKGIEEVLLVFSHDVWNEEINYLIQNVDFCRVMQIFYPYSIQIHPHSFPGESPDDCPRNIGKEQ